jgi:hypothetical protein
MRMTQHDKVKGDKSNSVEVNSRLKIVETERSKKVK